MVSKEAWKIYYKIMVSKEAWKIYYKILRGEITWGNIAEEAKEAADSIQEALLDFDRKEKKEMGKELLDEMEV